MHDPIVETKSDQGQALPVAIPISSRGIVRSLSNQTTDRPLRPHPPHKRCKRGHPLEGDNLLVEPSGARRCRICYRAAIKARDQRNRKGLRLVCANGHPLEGDNLIFREGGKRRCRTCYRDYWRARRAKAKATGPVDRPP